VGEVQRRSPVCAGAGGIDRQRLGQGFGHPEALRRLEGILHPKVTHRRGDALSPKPTPVAKPLIVLDIPLLHETRGTGRCDFVLVISGPARMVL
jgi:dephospho-CoA kinase